MVVKHKYMEGFLQLLNKEQNKNIEPLPRETLYSKSWIVYAKSPLGGPAQVIEYLGRYTQKVAISNHRIISVENDKVSFIYKDYAKAVNKNHGTGSNRMFKKFLFVGRW